MKKPYKCPFCWNRYGYEHSRALHIRDDHKNILQNPSLMKASESLIEYKVGFKSYTLQFFQKTEDGLTRTTDPWTCGRALVIWGKGPVLLSLTQVKGVSSDIRKY